MPRHDSAGSRCRCHIIRDERACRCDFVQNAHESACQSSQRFAQQQYRTVSPWRWIGPAACIHRATSSDAGRTSLSLPTWLNSARSGPERYIPNLRSPCSTPIITSGVTIRPNTLDQRLDGPCRARFSPAGSSRRSTRGQSRVISVQARQSWRDAVAPGVGRSA